MQKHIKVKEKQLVRIAKLFRDEPSHGVMHFIHKQRVYRLGGESAGDLKGLWVLAHDVGYLKVCGLEHVIPKKASFGFLHLPAAGRPLAISRNKILKYGSDIYLHDYAFHSKGSDSTRVFGSINSELVEGLLLAPHTTYTSVIPANIVSTASKRANLIDSVGVPLLIRKQWDLAYTFKRGKYKEYCSYMEAESEKCGAHNISVGTLDHHAWEEVTETYNLVNVMVHRSEGGYSEIYLGESAAINRNVLDTGYLELTTNDKTVQSIHKDIVFAPHALALVI